MNTSIIPTGLNFSFPNVYGREFTSEVYEYLFVTIVLVAILGIVAKYLQKIQQKRKDEEPPVGWIVDPKEIDDILYIAEARRARCELAFIRDRDEESRHFSCSLHGFKSNSILLEIPSRMQTQSDWINRSVHCYFNYFAGDPQPIFYSFQSVITSIVPQKNAPPLLAVQRPSALVMSQKRSFFRLTPQPKDILHIDVMPFDPEKARQGIDWFMTPNQTTEFPFMDYKTAPYKALDLSAQGIRILCENPPPELQKENMGGGLYFYIRLAVRDVDNEKKFTKYMFKAMSRRFYHTSRKDAVIGFQLLEMVHRPSGTQEKPTWKNINQYGKDSLENWVIRMSLKLYRESGVDPLDD
ncbi:MAG: hypothetical protein ACNI27_07585 [Desulfovibrio sp.]